MNAHADMLIVVGTTDITYQGAFTAFLFRVCEILQDFEPPKQAPINAFYYVCYPSPLMCRHPQRRFTVQRYYKICGCARKIAF